MAAWFLYGPTSANVNYHLGRDVETGSRCGDCGNASTKASHDPGVCPDR